MYEREVACKQMEGTFKLQPKQSAGASPVVTPREDPAALATKYYSTLQKTTMTVTCCCANAKRCFKSTLISPPPPSIHSQPVFSLLH